MAAMERPRGGPEDGPIPWKDPALVQALKALRAHPGGAEVMEDIGVEYLWACFLAAYGLRPEQALGPLRETAEWRRTSGAQEARRRLLAEPELAPKDFPHMAVMKKYMPMCEGGRRDRRGLPYNIRCVGMIDATGLLEALPMSSLLEWQVWIGEYRLLNLERYARRTGCLGDITIISDLASPEGILNLWTRHGSKVKTVMQLPKMADKHYPGFMGRVLMVNAPWAIHAILQVIKPVFPARMFSKIEIVPPGEQAQARLLEFVDAKDLPQWLGGQAPDDEFVANRATVAGPFGTEVTVKAGEKAERSLALRQGDVAGFGLSVGQGFDVGKGFDIMFSCRFEAAGAAPGTGAMEVRPPSRIVEDSGGSSFLAPSDGQIVMVFDNSYSWMNPKTVRYELAVMALPPQAGPS